MHSNIVHINQTSLHNVCKGKVRNDYVIQILSTVGVLCDTDPAYCQCFMGHRSCVLSVFYGTQILCTVGASWDTDPAYCQCFMRHRSCVLSVFYGIQILCTIGGLCDTDPVYCQCFM